MKRPAFQFYPADWRKDAALQSCPISARGVWHELLCVMHECQPYGHLVLNGKPMRESAAAQLIGVDMTTYHDAMAELEGAGVLSKLADGTVFSRRMVRDEQLRHMRAEFGKQGGNPRLMDKPKVNGHVKVEVNGGLNHASKQTPTPSSSASASASPSVLLSEFPNGNSSSGSAPDDAAVKQKSRAAKSRELALQAEAIVGFLNERANRRFPLSDTNIGVVVARLREGFTPVQLRQVIALKVRKWKGDPKMDEFLRPMTLFGKTNFSNYVGELVPDDGVVQT